MKTFVPSALGWGLCLWGSLLALRGLTQPVQSLETDILDTGISADILNQPVTSPFRRPGLLRDSSRPVYVVTLQQIREQGARTAQEALRYLPGYTTLALRGGIPLSETLALDVGVDNLLNQQY
ncbi:TonB-dependent receptor plug domain-containing protein [Thermostichus vulcanus]|uniref:TonB-dependent receptor plug domain-containing protein n=1 Tax=Thermostichus vulcanus TaxID=32053 RepID=UPI001FCB85AE|nr:TonB-dependent receptor plug domain-containing protein [Thermostichus vulcanus]